MASSGLLLLNWSDTHRVRERRGNLRRGRKGFRWSKHRRRTENDVPPVTDFPVHLLLLLPLVVCTVLDNLLHECNAIIVSRIIVPPLVTSHR
jgi:hypothetical protein